MLAWLLGAGLGPAAVAVPVNWAAGSLAGAAQRWFKRLRRADDLSRLVRAATGTSVDLTQAEFGALRKLLEDQQTWSVAGWGTVEDLATRIAACLPLREGRTADDSHAAALTIARGLIEFAVADLEPKLFQQVLMARLQRMETGQASALDEALLGLHARFDSVMDQLKLVLDRLPPECAGRGEIAVYLRTLIDWLSSDPWPRDPQFGGGTVLAPAAIEHKLRVTVMGRVREQDLDADGLAQQCVRLVILGGPGSGKTWLARRTARRCAEDALEVLAAGGTLEEAELPLYTTCSRLFGAGGDIREAVVSSALGQIGDLGGSRISKALSVFFAERNARILLVIDSLDEAHGPSERLRQASTLPWRIVLTSPPSSWRNQLTVKDTDDSHRVGELQPLDYPGDVEPFIERWFAGQPEQGNDLAAQIARRPGLQQAATVPLILAFYCIVGGTGPLPDFRRDLYTKVLNRMLTGRWRDDDDRQPDADTCLQTLRAWAWDGATSHPVSGVGTWADDIPAKRVRLGEADAHAVDHVATPLGRPDIDTGTTLRRFIHRSIREHLVAGHVASLPVDQAVKLLLPHLWYDPDWEHAAPAALAMHPQRDQLLRDLICRAVSSDHIPGDLSVIDAGWQVRGLLARVAAESSESDWSPEIAGMIGQARVELAQSGSFWDLGGAAHWGTSDRLARDALLGLLARETDSVRAGWLADKLVPLDPTAEDRRQARDALLGLLARATDGFGAGWLAAGLVPLATTAEDRRQARDALLGLLARETDSMYGRRAGGRAGPARPDGGGQAPGPRRAARAAGPRDRRHVWPQSWRPGWSRSPRRRRTGARPATRCSGCWPARPTAGGPQSWRAAAGPARPDGGGQAPGPRRAARAAGPRDRQQVGRMAGGRAGPARPDGGGQAPGPRRAARAAGPRDRRRVGRLAGGQAGPARDDGGGQAPGPRRAARAAGPRDRQRVGRGAGGQAGPARPDGGGQAPGPRRAARAAGPRDRQHVCRMAGGRAGPARPDGGGQAPGPRRAARAAGPRDRQHVCRRAGGRAGPARDDGGGQAPGPRRAARAAGPRDRQRVGRRAGGGALVPLDPTAEDRRQARDALLGLLARATDGRWAGWLADKLVLLDPTAEDRRQARDALLGLLARATDSGWAGWLAGGLVLLDPTAEDRRQARDALLARLARETNSRAAAELAAGLVPLGPTVHDLGTWRAWAVQPTSELLAAVRRNSALTNWLAVLPSLASLSGAPA